MDTRLEKPLFCLPDWNRCLIFFISEPLQESSRDQSVESLPSPLVSNAHSVGNDTTVIVDDSLDQERALLESEQEDGGSSENDDASTIA